MTDYQLKVILQLIIDKLNNCKTIEEFEQAKPIYKMLKSLQNWGARPRFYS